MQQQKTETPAGEPEMHRRQIRMEDGRYMIFYTFGVQTGEDGADAPSAGAASAGASSTGASSTGPAATGPQTPDIEAGEERHV